MCFHCILAENMTEKEIEDLMRASSSLDEFKSRYFEAAAHEYVAQCIRQEDEREDEREYTGPTTVTKIKKQLIAKDFPYELQSGSHSLNVLKNGEMIIRIS